MTSSPPKVHRVQKQSIMGCFRTGLWQVRRKITSNSLALEDMRFAQALNQLLKLILRLRVSCAVLSTCQSDQLTGGEGGSCR